MMIEKEITKWKHRLKRIHELGIIMQNLSSEFELEQIKKILYEGVYPLNSRLTTTNIKINDQTTIYLHERIRTKHKWSSQSTQLDIQSELKIIQTHGLKIATHIKNKDRKETFLKFYRLIKKFPIKIGYNIQREVDIKVKTFASNNKTTTLLEEKLITEIEVIMQKYPRIRLINSQDWKAICELYLTRLDLESLFILQQHYGLIKGVIEEAIKKTQKEKNKQIRILKKIEKKFEPILVAKTI